MCEILDQIENRGIQKGMEIMRAEKDEVIAQNKAVIAQNKAMLAEKEASLAEKDAELARKEAELARAMELLKKYKIVFVS